MSYTNKKITWEQCSTNVTKTVPSEDLSTNERRVVNNYETIENIYGDISRPLSKTILARKQPHEQVIRTTDGKEVLTKSYFYVDPRVEPNALSIEKMDKLDGETVMEKYVMCDLSNKPRMVRYITI